MKKDWEIKYLNEIANYSIGLTYSPKDIDEDGVVVLRSSNIQNKKIDLSDIVKVTKKIKPELFVKEGDILMCSRNGSQRLVGKTAIIPKLEFPSTYGTFMTLIRSDYNNYLYHFFNSDLFKKQIWIGENTMINQVTKYMLDKVNLPIPPLEEQQKIVEKLDKAFELIDQAKANIERNIQNAKELFQSKLDEVFSQENEGWLTKRLIDIGKVQTGNTPPTRDKENYGNYMEFIKPSHFTKRGELLCEDSFLSKQGVANGRLIKANSVLMVCIGATIGKLGFNTKDVCCNQQINTITPNENLLYKLLYYSMSSSDFISNIHIEGKSAQATLPIINKSKFEVQTVTYPKNKSDQEKIVKILDEATKLKDEIIVKYENKLSNLEELRKSILEKAFKGELTN